jgi:pimeloyl-ACP methyl ester carboxylesterase
VEAVWKESVHLWAVLIWLLAGCAGASPHDAGVSPNAPARVELQPCAVGGFPAKCGALSVFEDRAASSGRRIGLQVAVVQARSSQPAPDPIFYLAGGPGESAIEWASYAMSLLGSANEQRDVVFVDIRGTGGSNKLVCPQPNDPTHRVEALRACLADLDADPRAYTTVWAMDDVDDVRAVLGYDQINLYGGSIFARWPITSQRALELMFARCEADATCHSAFPDLSQEFAAVLARLSAAPITLPLTNPATGQPLSLTGEIFRTTVHNALASTPTAPMVPRFVHLIYSEDWDGLAAFLAPFVDSSSATPEWKIMNLTILCHEDWARNHPAETTEASAGSYLTYADIRALTVPEDICAAMPQPRAEALYGPLANSFVPVLFFNGEADPQDPPENVVDAKQRYPNSLGLVAPGQAHGFTGIPCRASIIADLIARGSVAGLSTQCLEQVELPAFVK